MTIKFEDNELLLKIWKFLDEIKVQIDFKKSVEDFIQLPKKFFEFENEKILRYQCGFTYNQCVYIFIIDVVYETLEILDYVLPRICLNEVINNEGVKVGA